MAPLPLGILLGVAFAVATGVGCSVSHPNSLPAGGDVDLAAYFKREAGVVPLPVSNPVFVDSGPGIRAQMLSLVRSAQDHILLDSFLLNDGLETREILDALAAKADEGVKVRVIGDASSRFVMEKDAFDYLKTRGVAVAEFNPVKGWRLLAPSMLFERDHRKFWIVDGRHVFLGGANLSDSSLVSAERGGNRDLMVRMDSPEAARSLTRSFVGTWNESDSPFAMDMAEFETSAKPMGEDDAEYWFFNQENVRTRPAVTAVMMDGLYASAREAIWLIEPYTFTSPGILEGIQSMTERGVEVNLVLSSQVRAPRFRYASFYGIRDLIEAGARVWIFDSGSSPLHCKCALVDGRLAYMGSANLNFRSFRLSRELSIVFDDAPSVAEIRRVVEAVRKNCREVTIDEAADYRSAPFAAWWLIMQTAG